MKIAAQTVVTLAYDISNEAGEIIESSQISGPVTFIHGRSGLIPGLDKRLIGMEVGQEATFEFPPEEAFGTVDQAPRKTIARAEFPTQTEMAVGSEFAAALPNGQSIRLRVMNIGPEEALVAMIHPLAGQTIGMHVQVLAVRTATTRELVEGRVFVSPPAPPPHASSSAG